ncbi:DUF1282 domain-containing protein [Pseudoduganella sp. FT93W]|uniref:DUF1282 domain-containing protein n=1 Tax=Duganella fentianensis TaxID=2692177 RepID=A0A845I5V2_9BURK|nr:YIP1 family protein [Duganella fentianensis]MYN47571.1 DUF1282 domain-containing protein [Duganella fentianensis]
MPTLTSCPTLSGSNIMNLVNLSKMPFSFHAGWDEVAVVHHPVIKTFLLLVLPFALLPPAILLYASNEPGSLLRLNAAAARWHEIALVFFVAELLTVPLMGWLIRASAAERKIAASFRDTFLLAAIIAIPMCLSSLGLLLPDWWSMLGLGLAGLMVAASLLYHGMYVVLKMDEQFEAQALAYQVFGFGALAWALLSAYILLQLLG